MSQYRLAIFPALPRHIVNSTDQELIRAITLSALFYVSGSAPGRIFFFFFFFLQTFMLLIL